MYHLPVLLEQSVEGLGITPEGVFADVTFGGGGHSRLILQKLGAEGRLLAFDQDEDALANAIDDERFTLINENFRYLKNFARFHKALPMDGVLADLGISSHQIDTPSRGFATRFDGPLDMRMTAKQKFTAAFLLNTYPEDKLYDIFSLYGEVSNAHLLAKTIVQARVEPLQTIGELKSAIKSCMPAGFEHKYLAKVFQAIRIELNDELGALKLLLTQATEVLKPGGRLVVIAYHSLEDRLVKNFMKTGNFNGDPQKDFYGNLLAPFTPVTRKPIVPSASELNTNPRSRSARLRIASKN